MPPEPTVAPPLPPAAPPEPTVAPPEPTVVPPLPTLPPEPLPPVAAMSVLASVGEPPSLPQA
ncbi:MAG TPA: hypothetical protein VGP07_24045 [Polyangia bacterium]